MDYDGLVNDIVERVHNTCDNIDALFTSGTTTFDGTTPYAAFWHDCYNKLDL